jgi:hypothetical protein
MNMFSLSDSLDQWKFSEELHETPWWHSLMNDQRFLAAYERNFHMRLKLSDTSYLKKLLRSEGERQAFVTGVLHPRPEDLATPDDDE